MTDAERTARKPIPPKFLRACAARCRWWRIGDTWGFLIAPQCQAHFTRR